MKKENSNTSSHCNELPEEEKKQHGMVFLTDGTDEERESLKEIYKNISNIENQEKNEYVKKIIKTFIIKPLRKNKRVFLALLQGGISVSIMNDFLEDESLLDTITDAANEGLILGLFGDDAYLIDANDDKKKTIKIINCSDQKSNSNDDQKSNATGLCNPIFQFIKNTNNKQNSDEQKIERIQVYAHPYKAITRYLRRKFYSHDNSTLHLYPLNDNFLSCISAEQTECVENTCKIVNYFTEQYKNFTEQHKNEKHKNEKMNVILEGKSKGCDFITKMVGSTHGRGYTRIKNANIDLHIDSSHLFQDPQKLVERLRRADKSNTFNTINVKNSASNWLHPECKTGSLIGWLQHYKQTFNNNVEINDLRILGSNQQNTLY